MKDTNRLLMNVGLVAMVALLFTGCSLLPGSTPEKTEVMVEDENFTEVSEDDSLEVIEAELDATVIEDDDEEEVEAVLGVTDWE